MTTKCDYPDDWQEIATAVKKAAGYRCSRCYCQCLPPTPSYRHLALSIRRSLSAQVHHIDGNPASNHRANLVCLCAGCHLRVHKMVLRPLPGQLSLKLKLPKSPPARKIQRRRIQITLADLIDRLPPIPSRSDRQLELDLDRRCDRL
jgi:5-methylcytosine-specific restriction endonuclease McrA